MKKALSLLLALILTVGLLAACGSTASEPAPSAPASSAAASAAESSAPAAEEGEPYTVVITYPMVGQAPADLLMIEEAVNAITIPETNTQVELYPVPIFDLATQTNLMISAGEKLDAMLCMTGLSYLADYVNKGQVIELDDLVEEYGQDIVAAESIAMQGGYFQGKLYAVPTEEKMGRQNGFAFRADILDKYSISMPEDEYVTYEMLDEWFATIKAGEGEDFYMLAANGAEIGGFTGLDAYDNLGGSLVGLPAGGRGDDMTVENMYADEGYATHLDWMRKWYEAGYIHPDIATLAEGATELMKTGRYLGTVMTVETDMEFNVERDYGMDMTMLASGPPAVSTAVYQITTWAIPITCEDPVATMKFLNLMYASEEICNLLHNGIEGVHYEKTDAPGIIRYPEGLDVTTTGYNNPLGVWGDKFKKYQWEPAPASYFDDLAAFNEEIINTPEWHSKALGFTFDSDPVKTETAAVSDVLAQYRPTLNSGSVDPAEMLPEFLSALESAGIGTIVAEAQTQLDAWLAEKQV